MGRTVALNANVVVRSTVKTFLMLKVMLGLSWELTLLTCIEMPLLAILQNRYISLSKVGVVRQDLDSSGETSVENRFWWKHLHGKMQLFSFRKTGGFLPHQCTPERVKIPDVYDHKHNENTTVHKV